MKRNATKKPAAARREQERRWKWEDAVEDHCRHLTTLARLLENGGRDTMMDTALVSSAGALIRREVGQLKTLLEKRP